MATQKVPHQTHFGRKFYEDKKTGYWISTDYPRIRAHRWVWLNVNGPIPKSTHVHHRNEDKSDNRIENLQLVSFRQHAMIHMDSERMDELRARMDHARISASKWHKSKEGRAWHRLHAIKCKFGQGPLLPKTCEHCGKSFESRKVSRALFCTNACKSAWRRAKGLDDRMFTCPICQKEFKANRYAKQKHCSRACGGLARRVSRRVLQ